MEIKLTDLIKENIVFQVESELGYFMNEILIQRNL